MCVLRETCIVACVARICRESVNIRTRLANTDRQSSGLEKAVRGLHNLVCTACAAGVQTRDCLGHSSDISISTFANVQWSWHTVLHAVWDREHLSKFMVPCDVNPKHESVARRHFPEPAARTAFAQGSPAEQTSLRCQF